MIYFFILLTVLNKRLLVQLDQFMKQKSITWLARDVTQLHPQEPWPAPLSATAPSPLRSQSCPRSFESSHSSAPGTAPGRDGARMRGRRPRARRQPTAPAGWARDELRARRPIVTWWRELASDGVRGGDGARRRTGTHSATVRQRESSLHNGAARRLLRPRGDRSGWWVVTWPYCSVLLLHRILLSYTRNTYK